MYNPARRVIKNYDYRDGLQGDEFNARAFCRTPSGEMYFGGTVGISGVRYLDVGENQHIPPIVVTEFKAAGRTLAPEMFAADRTVHLLFSENSFSVEFAALDFECPEKNQYAYRLEGLDEHWTNSGVRRFASYTNLDPGRYVLHILGTNNDGVWNEAGMSVQILVHPPFWKTWWFTLFWFGTFSFSLMYGLHRRFSQLRERERTQQEVSRRILESQEDERKRIGASLHDSLGQNLLMIKNLAMLAMGEDGVSPGATGRIEEISSLASHALAEVREISYDLRPYLLEQLGLTGAIRSICSRAGRSSGIVFQVRLDTIDGLIPKEQEINFFRIIQEAINNLVKHSGTSEASVEVIRNSQSIVTTIRDHGIGFSGTVGGFGLNGMSERARILGSTLHVQSSPGLGTTISVVLPVKEKQ